MLSTLQIEDYALIEQVSMDFGPGFNVLTGETGSGKSIIVDALGLLLGERAEGIAIRSGAAQATVTGSFLSPFGSLAASRSWCEANGLSPLGEEIVLHREVNAGGRSRAFLDHQLTTLALLRDLARRLGEIHSQNEALVAFTPATQLQLLDRFAGAGPDREAVAQAFAAWSEWNHRLRELTGQERQRLQQIDLWRFQANEIDAAQLQPLPQPESDALPEDGALERERLALANAEKIAASAQAAYDCLYEAPAAALAQLKSAARHLGDWSRFDDRIAPLLPRLDALRAETSDISEQIRAFSSRQETSPRRLAEIEERLLALDRLKRKYGPTLADVVRYRAGLAAQLEAAGSAEAQTSEARTRLEAAAAAYRRLAAELSARRRAAAVRLGEKLEAEVADLAMQLAFRIEFQPPSTGEASPPAPPESEWTETGWDRIRFLASTNPGEPLLPIERTASGGELSRLLLALHLVAVGKSRPGSIRQASAVPKTLVLDEIDAGIGGRAADAVGRKLRQLGAHYQVLCVTHLAQIASYASRHLRVEKRERRSRGASRTHTQVQALDPASRVSEIARMLDGDHLNPTSLRHAEELLAARAAAR